MRRLLGSCLGPIVWLLAAAGPAAAAVPATADIRVDLPERGIVPETPATVAVAFDADEPGRWLLSWDPGTEVVAAGVRGLVPAPGTAARAPAVLQNAEAFRARHADRVGAEGATLRRVRAEPARRSWHVTWIQEHAGEPVVDAWLDVVLDLSGSVVAFRSTLVPRLLLEPDGNADPLAACAAALGRSVWPRARADVLVPVLADDGVVRVVPAIRLDLGSGHAERWEALVARADGRVLRLESRLRTARLEGTASALALPLHAQDDPVELPLSWLDVTLRPSGGALRATTDALGRFAFDTPPAAAVPLAAGLTGLYLDASNQAGDPPPSWSRDVEVPGGIAARYDQRHARLDERTIYVHANRIHDWARERFDFRLLDFPLPAVASVRSPGAGAPDYANAYWNGEGIFFGNGATVFYNLGQFADVIYHEYVHGITDYMYRPLGGLGGLQGSAIHEALSDYFAATLTDDPRIGEQLYRDALQNHLRNLENNLQWPADAVYEAHGDGEIFGGALWDLRRLTGAAVADALVHFARNHGPRHYEDYVLAVLLEDDLQFGDGQALNGSPHRAAILAAFAAHGYGPAAAAGRRILHAPLHDTEDAGVARIVRADIENGLSVPRDTLRLHVSVDGGPFAAQVLQRQADGGFVGVIPGGMLAEGARVRYYLRAVGRGGRLLQSAPPGAPDSTYAFRVGADLEPPRIAHVGLGSAAVFAWPARLVVRIEDNLGVALAWAETWRNDEPSALLGMARDPADPGRYTAEFANVGQLGDRFAYRIVAVDAARAANVGTLPADGSRFEFSLVEVLREDFEAGGGGWEHDRLIVEGNDSWYWSDVQNHTPAGRRAWHCGDPAGEYPTRVAAALETDPYPLGANARARVWSWIDAEPNGPREAFDGAVIELRVDDDPDWRRIDPLSGYTHVVAPSGGTNWLPPGTPCLSGRDRTWRELRFDLAPHAGRRVRLRFVFAADHVPSIPAATGWFLDDFELDPGLWDPTDALGDGPAEPGRLLVAAPFPNPFNPRVSFSLTVPAAAGPVRLVLFDVRGRQVRVVHDGQLDPGPHRLDWNGRTDAGLALPSGVYYYRLVSRLGAEQGRLVLAR